ncbi:site-2 protease family protein [Halobacteriales archaeon Cl-PHB]
MVSVLTWVLVGILAYTLVAMALQSRDVLPESVRVSGPITTLRTKRGRAFLDRLARPRRFWRALSNFGVGMALVVMVGSALMIAFSVLLFTQQPESAQIRDPQNYLAIPGVNEFLPLTAAPSILAGLAIGMVVHEGGHGLLCRVENIDIESMGLAFFTIIPIGAFVEPDEESQERADRGGQVRMFAAGVTANFIVTLVAYLLLFGPVVGSIAVAPGVPVGSALPGSTADQAGIGNGDVIQQVEGVPVANQSALDDRLQGIDDPTVDLTFKRGETATVDRHLVVTRTVPAIEQGLDLEGAALPTIERVNGTAVRTEAALEAAVRNNTVVELQTDSGTATFPAGAYVVQVAEGGPLADAGAPTNASLVITRLGDQRVVDTQALVEGLEAYEPGDQVTVEAYVEGQRQTYDVELGTAEDGGALVGAAKLSAGYGGLVAEDFGVDPYPAERFLASIGGASSGAGLFDGNVFGFLLFALFLPLGSLLGLDYNFAGFVGGVSNFYVIDGPLAILGSGVFVLANVLFWTGWVNLNLGVFNCFPAFPLDGGHIFRNSVESIVSRLPVENRRRLATVITTLTTVTMIGLFLVMVFGPSLIG